VFLWFSIRLDLPAARLVARHASGFRLFAPFTLAGFLPLWLLISFLFIAVDSIGGRRGAWSRGGLLLTAAWSSGIVAALLQLLARRQRPSLNTALVIVRPWQPGPLVHAPGWPSTTTAIAFAAVIVLCRLHPRGSPIWLFVGTGYLFARIAAGGPAVSDCVAGMLVAMVMVAQLAPKFPEMPARPRWDERITD